MDENLDQPSESKIIQEETADAGRFGRFSFSRAFRLAFQTVNDHRRLTLGLGIFGSSMMLIGSQLMVGYLFIPHLNAGLVMAGLQMVRKKGQFKVAFSGFKAFTPIFVAGVLFLILILTLVALTLIPVFFLAGLQNVQKSGNPDILSSGVTISFIVAIITLAFSIYYYLNGRLTLVYPLILERRYNVWQAFKTSWEKTEPDQWGLFLFNIVEALLVIPALIAGFLALIVGLLVTYPFYFAFTFAMEGAAIYQLFGEEKRTRTGFFIEL